MECCCTAVWAQEGKAAKTGDAPAEQLPLYRGVMVDVDAFSAVVSAFTRERYSFEAGVRVNLKEKFFPVLEMGVAGADRTSANGYGFRTNGFFARVGMDYNLLKPQPADSKINRYIFVGVRYGFSPFAYDVTGVWVDNGYWGDGVSRDYLGVTAVKHWAEVVGGIRVEVFRNLYMGWGMRLKVQLSQDKPGAVSPWYIPGIGIKSAGNFGFNYTVGYQF